MKPESETLDRCPTCGAYTSAENGYIGCDPPSLTMDEGGRLRAYCSQNCYFQKMADDERRRAHALAELDHAAKDHDWEYLMTFQVHGHGNKSKHLPLSKLHFEQLKNLFRQDEDVTK